MQSKQLWIVSCSMDKKNMRFQFGLSVTLFYFSCPFITWTTYILFLFFCIIFITFFFISTQKVIKYSFIPNFPKHIKEYNWLIFWSFLAPIDSALYIDLNTSTLTIFSGFWSFILRYFWKMVFRIFWIILFILFNFYGVKIALTVNCMLTFLNWQFFTVNKMSTRSKRVVTSFSCEKKQKQNSQKRNNQQENRNVTSSIIRYLVNVLINSFFFIFCLAVLLSGSTRYLSFHFCPKCEQKFSNLFKLCLAPETFNSVLYYQD